MENAVSQVVPFAQYFHGAHGVVLEGRQVNYPHFNKHGKWNTSDPERKTLFHEHRALCHPRFGAVARRKRPTTGGLATGPDGCQARTQRQLALQKLYNQVAPS